MKTTKIECPNCQQRIEVELPASKRKVLWLALALIAGLLLGAGGLYAGLMLYAKHRMLSETSQWRPAKATNPISGAFGFTLGQKLDDVIAATADEDGAGLGAIIETSNYPPFDTIVILTLADRRIYSIGAMYHGDNWFEESRTLQAALETKYGPGKKAPAFAMEGFDWADEHHSIHLTKDSLDYSDDTLSKIAAETRAAAKSKKAKAIAPSL